MTRRLALQVSLGLFAAPAMAEARLPQFRTARYQFIELDPVEPLAPLPLSGWTASPPSPGPCRARST
jgi:hypothetical protein